MRYFIAFVFCFIHVHCSAQTRPLKVGVAGLTHSHVGWILGRENKGDIKIVGISEKDTAVVNKYARQYKFSKSIVYPSLKEMVAAVKPDAVLAFGSIYEHLEVVQTCAPKGIHVMVEKPLAVNMKHASEMERLAKKHHIQLLTNYETTWYPSNHKIQELLNADSIGKVRKIVVHDGHKGPTKINVPSEFFHWLTDPVLNGGGAVIDFGCYGVNLTTWLLNGEMPKSVTANLQRMQPENYPKVEDDATILLEYVNANAVVQPSWNWPVARKDIEVYGAKGQLFAPNGNSLVKQISTGYGDYREEKYSFSERPYPYNDPFSLLAAVINKDIVLPPYDLSSLENNMMVVKILDAAFKSARKGKTIKLK